MIFDTRWRRIKIKLGVSKCKCGVPQLPFPLAHGGHNQPRHSFSPAPGPVCHFTSGSWDTIYKPLQTKSPLIFTALELMLRKVYWLNDTRQVSTRVSNGSQVSPLPGLGVHTCHGDVSYTQSAITQGVVKQEPANRTARDEHAHSLQSARSIF